MQAAVQVVQTCQKLFLQVVMAVVVLVLLLELVALEQQIQAAVVVAQTLVVQDRSEQHRFTRTCRR